MAEFQVDVIGVEDLLEIEGAWSSEDFRALLGEMDFDEAEDLPEDQLREMCVMYLQDRKPAEAAEILLRRRLGGDLTKGQISNISHEMLEEKLWEQYSDMTLHERLFHVGSLLAAAFPRSVPEPDAVEVRLEVRGLDPEAQRALDEGLREPMLVRLLAAGMPASAPLHRMFGEAVQGGPFREAESIAWSVQAATGEGGVTSIRVIGSGCWLDILKRTSEFQAKIKADKK
ncbi:hypothetical protein Poly30_08020 [Planctomycetes bacterium Poly30]|uniref:Uncharacterized protein n=1 Tax=Saltatorellus ferox TaxID=2528018 RepID=A0A518EMK2_9BACT|nr:hypothetical protein Poly30_08020 [Planctomycetes bacterium Poly30]